MQKAPVLSKRDFYRRWHLNEFGNRPGSWNSIEEAEAAGFQGPLFGVRSTKPMWSGFRRGILWRDRRKVWQEYVDQGEDPSTLRIGQDVPEDKRTLQGHVYRTHRGLDLEYSLKPGTVRDVMQSGFERAWGVKAKVILETYMCPSSFADLEAIFELYDGHVVEFTCFSVNVGLIPGRNTVIWEVRDY